MKVPPHAVLFDMDGVLADSEPVHCELFLKLAREAGCPVSEPDHDELVGLSPKAQWEIMRDRFGLKRPAQEYAARQAEMYLERVYSPAGIPPVPGVKALLERLHGAGIPLGVASSNTRETVDAVVAALGFRAFFTALTGGDEVARGKPFPDVFLSGAEKLGAKPEWCVVVEDAENGVRAALDAGAKCAAFRNPRSGNQDLRSAHLVVEDYGQLDAGALRALWD